MLLCLLKKLYIFFFFYFSTYIFLFLLFWPHWPPSPKPYSLFWLTNICSYTCTAFNTTMTYFIIIIIIINKLTIVLLIENTHNNKSRQICAMCYLTNTVNNYYKKKKRKSSVVHSNLHLTRKKDLIAKQKKKITNFEYVGWSKNARSWLGLLWSISHCLRFIFSILISFIYLYLFIYLFITTRPYDPKSQFFRVGTTLLLQLIMICVNLHHHHIMIS